MDYDEAKTFKKRNRKEEEKILFSNKMDELVELWEQQGITMFRLQNVLKNGQSRII